MTLLKIKSQVRLSDYYNLNLMTDRTSLLTSYSVQTLGKEGSKTHNILATGIYLILSMTSTDCFPGHLSGFDVEDTHILNTLVAF